MKLFRKADNKLAKGDLYNRWQSRIKNAEFARYPYETNWARWMNMMDDNLWKGLNLPDGNKPADVNLLKSTLMSIIPHLILEPPEIEIRAYSPQFVDQAFFWEKVAEYLERNLDLYEEFLLCAYDGLLLGDGITKVGYWDDVMIGSQPWASGLTIPHGILRSAFTSYSSLFEIWPDYSVKRWRDIPFIIQQTWAHIDDVKSTPGYNKRLVNKLVPTASAEKIYQFETRYVTKDGTQTIDNNDEYVLLQEIHDFRNGKMLVCANEMEGFLYEGPEPYSINPYQNLSFFPRPGNQVWGDSVSQSIEKHIKDYSEVQTYEMNRVQLEGLTKVLVKAGNLDDTGLKQLEASTGNQIIQVPDIKDFVEVLDYGTSKTQYIFETSKNSLGEMIRLLSGVTQQEQGRHEAGVETKYEASMLKAASDVRNAMRKKMFSRFASAAVTKLLYVVSLEYPPAKLVEMAGLGQEYIYPVSQFGPFDASKFVVDYGMTALNSRKERIEKLMMLRQLVPEGFLNPVALANMSVDALGFNMAEELVIFNGIQQGGNAATQQQPQLVGDIQNSRVANPGTQPPIQMNQAG